jgi:hypothetical protein
MTYLNKYNKHVFKQCRSISDFLKASPFDNIVVRTWLGILVLFTTKALRTFVLFLNLIWIHTFLILTNFLV